MSGRARESAREQEARDCVRAEARDPRAKGNRATRERAKGGMLNGGDGG